MSGRRRQGRPRRKPLRVRGHAGRYEVVRDPEGNFWTVTCECGRFQESGSTRAVARHEHGAHLLRELTREPEWEGPVLGKRG
jgi:hypothetical protein